MIAPLTNVDDWDDAPARDMSQSHELIDAEGCGGNILSSEVDGDIRTTVVRLNVAARTADRQRESHDINLAPIFQDRIADLVGEVRRGAGRCIEAKPVSASGGRGAAFLDNGKQVLSAEFTYKGRVG